MAVSWNLLLLILPVTAPGMLIYWGWRKDLASLKGTEMLHKEKSERCGSENITFCWSTLHNGMVSESEVKVAQSCPTLCNPMDCIWIMKARITEWAAIPFSRGSSQPRDWTQVCHVAGRFFASWATTEAHGLWTPRKNCLGNLSVCFPLWFTKEKF